MTFINYKAEISIINAMMNGHIDEITTKLDKNLLQSPQAIEAYWKIYTLNYKHDHVSERIVLDDCHKAGATKLFDYISNCCAARTSAEEIGYYISELKTSYICKLGQEYADEIKKQIFTQEVDVDKVSALLRSGLQLEAEIEGKETLKTPKEIASEMFTDYYERLTGEKKREGIQIKSMPKLDDVMYGLNPQELTIICAQSGKGKTAFALNIARDIAVEQGIPILYANAEMSVKVLTARIASQLTSIAAREIIRAEHMEGERTSKALKISEATDQIANSGFHVSDLPVMTIGKIRRDFKKMALAGNAPKVIFVDYLGRMEAEGANGGKKEYEILQSLAESCKIMARELNVCVVALAQLSEAGTIEASKRIKNPCENLIFLEQVLDPPEDDDKQRMTERQQKYCNYKLTFNKARNGPDGTRLYIQFNKTIQKVIEVE